MAGELGFALGGVLSISRLGSVINNALSPYIASATYSVAAPLWCGTLLCTLGLLSCVAVQWLDADAARVLRANPALLVEPSPPPPPRFVLAATSTNASPVAAAVPSASFSYRAPPLPPLRTKLPPLPSNPSRSAATDAQRPPAVTPSDGGDGGSGGAASGTPPTLAASLASSGGSGDDDVRGRVRSAHAHDGARRAHAATPLLAARDHVLHCVRGSTPVQQRGVGAAARSRLLPTGDHLAVPWWTEDLRVRRLE